MNTPEQVKEIERKWRNYQRCSQGKPASCSKCIGCASKK